MRIVYVSKFPPSRSGVARYADQFLLVLKRLGDVTVLKSGHEAEETSHPIRIVQIVARVRRALQQDPDLVVFEVSGQALAEFLATALAIRIRRKRSFAVWLTVHDSPAVTGGLFWIGWLRHRGLRRVAALLSKRIGTRVERWVLSEADIVVCLSAAGARALEDAYSLDRRVQTIHFVAEVAPETRKQRRAFLPGPIQLDAADEVLTAFAPIGSDLELLVGFCDSATRMALQRRAEELGLAGQLHFAGFLDQNQLLEAYRSSLVVIHWYARHDPHWGHANSAACSAPAIDALAAGSALLTNAARGAGEYVDESAAAHNLVASHDSLGTVLANLLRSPNEAEALGTSALDYASRTLSVSAVAEEVGCLLQASVPDVVGSTLAAKG